METIRERTVKAGTFDFGGSVDVTDPCYDHRVWCRLNGIRIAEGKYACIVRRRDCGIWGERTAAIGIYREGSPEPRPGDAELIGSIGVDSGMAGFFHDKKDFSNEEWDSFCSLASERRDAWIAYGGFFSSSGYGDGGYDVYACRDNDGEIIGMEIVFIGDEKCDDVPDEDKEWEEEEE